MSLSSVLVDRGRALTNQALQQRMPDGSLRPLKVEGETQYQYGYGPYFDCRVDSPAAAEGNDPSGGKTQVEQHPTLIFDVYDENDDPVVLHASNRVAVESEDFGTAVFELTGEPVVYRKKYGLVCGEAALVRVLDPGISLGPVARVTDTESNSTVTVTGGGF